MDYQDMGSVVNAGDVADLAALPVPAPIAQGSLASGWVADNNTTNHTTTIPHNLGSTPNWCQVWFTGSGKQDYLVSWAWAANYSGNPVTISANKDSVFLEIYKGAPLHGVWDGSTGQWHTFTSGYWRIVVG